MQYSLEEHEEREVFTVSELNQSVRNLLEANFPSLWIEGEISNLVVPHSGHMYFSLKDSAAQVRCAMFKGRNRSLSFKPEAGMQVLMRASVSLYAGRGDYQLLVEYMEEAGDGALKRAFDKLKQKLFKEGLFAEENKQKIPEFVQRIGVITSSTGAAVRDILSVLKRRFPLTSIIIYPSLVQGETAAANIVKQIQTANQRKECDVLILARGGGSLEDLWPFNEEIVARAIFKSKLAIVSGVGHEIDVTIADFVADLRAPTPSAAAELISPDQNEYLNDLNAKYEFFEYIIQQQLERLQEKVLWLKKRLRHPKQELREKQQRLDFLEEKIKHLMQQALTTKEHRFKQLIAKLESVSPLATLKRGYSIIASKKDEVITSLEQVNINDELNTRLVDGVFSCKVLEKL